MNKEERYDIVVYRHRKRSNDEVFYIGIGNDKRPYKKHGRNKHWKNTVKKHGYYVEILKTDLSWEDACELEMFLIEIYGRRDLGTGTLVNLTDGGEGAYGRKVSKNTTDKIVATRLYNGGFIPTEETKQKMKISGKERFWSEEHKKAVIETALKYQHLTTEILSIPIIVITVKETFKFKSILEASKILKVSQNTIRKKLKGGNVKTGKAKNIQIHYGTR